MEELTRQVEAIARDREAGASEILQRVLAVLQAVMSQPVDDRVRIARAVCRAQPGMAPVWNAALAAASDDNQPARFQRFADRVRRASAALTRLVSELFADATTRRTPAGPGPLSLVTLSRSGSVEQALVRLAQTQPIRVTAAEGRPALEGRRLATQLAEAGAAVTLVSDAAIAEGLHEADAVVVGADAVASDWIMNKVGTRMLAAAASLAGVPVYVVAGREKFCAPTLAPSVVPRDGAPGEIWDAPSPGIVVRNPYFERVPLDLVAAVVTDAGVIPAANVAQVCASLGPATPAELVEQLAR
jgi:translation initiation factor 2B subunit (eIF-2B alpha/beta/delta family)